jgi:septum site-determining protein MinC
MLDGKLDPDAPAPSTGREQQPVASAINIKGRAGGILIEIGKGQWPDLMTTLAERLAGAGNFFRNGAVALDLAARPLTEPELRQVHKMLIEQALELVLVRTAAPETFQVALDMGLAAQLESLEGQSTVSAQPAPSNLAHEQHFVYAGHLRAGQVLQRREHILIIGDVNPGATVISDGDILVWGHLRGMAQAGSSGDAKAVVAALHLIPVQLRIGDFIAIAPEQKHKRGWGRQRAPVKQPEVAYLNGDRIVVEPWDATKFGGIAALRQ